jgi:Ran GTPase-activating protein (RanGAP) involved in mRNA processing and transport
MESKEVSSLTYTSSTSTTSKLQNLPDETIATIASFIGNQKAITDRLSKLSRRFYNISQYDPTLHRHLCATNQCSGKNLVISRDPITRLEKVPDVHKVVFSNKIRDFPVSEIVDVLIRYPRIHKLTIQTEYLHDAEMNALSQFMATNTTINDLVLKENHLLDTDIRIFADALRTNTTLQILDLSRNQFTPVGLRHLVDALKVNHTLKVLNLTLNRLGGDSGIFGRVISDLLINNDSLKHLDISACGIEDADVEFFSQGLAQNTTLNHLDMKINKMTNAGAEHLVTALERNTTVTIDYERNNMQIVHRLSSVLRRGKKMECIIS